MSSQVRGYSGPWVAAGCQAELAPPRGGPDEDPTPRLGDSIEASACDLYVPPVDSGPQLEDLPWPKSRVLRGIGEIGL